MQNPTDSIVVRFINPGDIVQWLALWEEYQRFYKVDLSDETTKTTLARFFDPNEPVFGGVAVENDRIVGLVNYVIHRSTWSADNFCYLEDLIVLPEIRGKGIGKQLIEWVQKQAKDNQCSRLYWHTQETNKRAQKLYDWVAETPGVIEYRMPL